MRRFLLIILAAVIVLLVVAVVILGAFPPLAHRQAVEHVVPNSRFQPGQ